MKLIWVLAISCITVKKRREGSSEKWGTKVPVHVGLEVFKDGKQRSHSF